MSESENDIKGKFQQLFQSAQSELKKATEIGKKMLSASQANSQLKDSLEDLGQLVFNSIERGDLKWENDKVLELMNTIKDLESTLAQFEQDVQEIKKEV